MVLQDQSFSGGAPVSVRTNIGASFTAVTGNLADTQRHGRRFERRAVGPELLAIR
jgi:hypothetical protein